MRKETDLRKVKATARALLMLDLGETDFLPMIVKHPFTDSGITAIPKPDGSIQMLNLMDDPSDLKRWRDFVSQTIEKSGSAYEVYMMVTNCPCLGDKFASAAWTAEVVKGTLYGRVDVRLHEELTEEELDRLKEWITSQNEAACDLIEGQPSEPISASMITITIWMSASR